MTAKYNVTTCLNDHPINFQAPIDDPFIHTTVHIGWRDLLVGLLRAALGRGTRVSVIVGADTATINAVMTLGEDLVDCGEAESA